VIVGSFGFEPGGVVSEPRTLTAVTPSRKAGIARLIALEDELLVAWTEVGDDGSTRVRSLLVRLGD